jgi:hypothetical protein
MAHQREAGEQAGVAALMSLGRMIGLLEFLPVIQDRANEAL